MATNAELRRRERSLSSFVLSELRPKGPLLTPFNIISVPIILAGLLIVVIRFAKGLGAVTNLSQEFPWGLWIGFDVMTGVAFAGGAYIITFAVYVMRAEKYHPIVRATVLNGFLGYVFYASALLLDLGRPWHAINPIIGNSFGYNSVLFLVSWHFMLYMAAELVEFSPVVAEWLGLDRARRILSRLTLATVVFGVTLSSLHQSGLGALFLMAKGRIHPLWYTEFLPVLFLVSSVFAGLSMVIFEGSITHRVFSGRVDPKQRTSFEDIVLGLGRGASVALFVYFFFHVLVFLHGKHWVYMHSGWGIWYLVEMLGFVLLPCALFAHAYRIHSIALTQAASVVTMLGVILNRLNISIIAFNWRSSVRYVPSVAEVVVTLMVVFIEIWVFRWVVNRMPVLEEGSHQNA